MKKYVIFAYYHFYPCGGLDDIVTSVDTRSEALTWLKENATHHDYKKVVDRDTWEIVYENDEEVYKDE